jgi:hypothetical protein
MPYIHTFHVYHIIVVVVCILAVLKLISYVDSRYRTRRTLNLIQQCTESSGQFTVLLMGSQSEELSETLFTLFQHAECPEALRITLVESLESLEKESTTMKLYKQKVLARGLYTNDFMHHVEVHQVKARACVMAEALQLCSRERKYVLICDESNYFLEKWDTRVNAISHRPAFCGAVQSDGSSSSSSSYTYIQSFQHGVPQISHKKLERSGPPVTCVWAATPLLVDTSELNKMHGCSVGDSMLLYSLSGKQLWTTEEPIALRHENGGITTKTTFTHEEFNTFGTVSNDSIMGLRAHEAKPLEIIMKFGSLGNYKWAQHES